MPPETKEQRYNRWVRTVNVCKEQGWKFAWLTDNQWAFKSPSGSIHDLSAADLSSLDLIEKEGYFQL